jgi:hypothetical protein
VVAGLRQPHPGIQPGARHQLIVRAVLDDPPFLHHDNAVGIAHG